MKLFIVLVSIVIEIQAIQFSDSMQEQWTSFKVNYNKQYKDESEEELRMKIFVDNLDRIERHNQNYKQNLVTYKLAVNHLTDLSEHEVSSMLNGYRKTKRAYTSSITFIPPANVQEPDEIDWTAKGAVTEVKNQRQCGSCWSFSATGALEGQQFRKTGNLVSLSEQNLIDCTITYGNGGCNGGEMNTSFIYIKENGGIDTEESYPYEAKNGTCRYNPNKSGATVSGYVNIKSGSEDDLKSAVATQGPIAVAIDTDHFSFQSYGGGVYDEPNCSDTKLGHAVLVTGYGTTSDGVDYWIVKNSWSTHWGENGYILMSRNKKNQCGIATDALYPLV